MYLRYALAASFLCLSPSAWAQQCPPGIAHGTPGCIPPNNPASPLYPQDTPVAPPVIWADRWGAIAVDGISGSLGVAVGMGSEEEAQSVALSQCRAEGGDKCKVDMAYFNQCAVMILGDHIYTTARAPTIDKATELGMQKCGKEDVNCRVYYADCSMAERIQ